MTEREHKVEVEDKITKPIESVKVTFNKEDLGPCAAHGLNPCNPCFEEWKKEVESMETPTT